MNTAKSCTAPPSPPDSGSTLMTSSGARYGPDCREVQAVRLDPDNCPGVTTLITSTERVTEWTFSSGIGVNEIFLRLEMTSPPLEFMVQYRIVILSNSNFGTYPFQGDPTDPLVKVTATNNSNIYGVHLDVSGSRTKKFKGWRKLVGSNLKEVMQSIGCSE